MTRVLLRCANCGAEPNLDAALVTVTIDLADYRATVPHVCPLCGAESESCVLGDEVTDLLLDGGAQLAVKGG